MESIAHKVESLDAETAGLVIADMRFLETDDVNLLSVCYRADDAALRGRQTLDIELQDPQCWADGLKVVVRVGWVVVDGMVWAGIHFTLDSAGW
jgi:hypothetical protein